MAVIVVPKAFDYKVIPDKDLFKRKLYSWMNLHTNDHIAFISAINSLRNILGKPLLKPHRLNLFFNPDKIDTVNKFLMFNAIEHKEIYRMINDLGQLCIPIFYVMPVLNIIEQTKDLSIQTFGQILFHENRVHTLTARAINLLYEALGGNG